MTKKELMKRYVLFIVGLFFEGVGVAFTKHGELGVSPISSVANVMNSLIPSLSLGTWLLIWNCLLLAAQILILRRDFQLIQLLQIPLSVLFGAFTDLGMRMVSGIPVEMYGSKLLMLVIGIFILAFGIELTVIANVVLNSGEALVKDISDKVKKPFGNVKVAFDISCVVAAVVLSLIFFHGKIIGTREGTIISACCTEFVVKLYAKMISRPVNTMLA